MKLSLPAPAPQNQVEEFNEIGNRNLLAHFFPNFQTDLELKLSRHPYNVKQLKVRTATTYIKHLQGTTVDLQMRRVWHTFGPIRYPRGIVIILEIRLRPYYCFLRRYVKRIGINTRNVGTRQLGR